MRDALGAVFSAIEVRSETELVFAGRTMRLLETFGAAHPPPLLASLQSLLYEHAYCRNLDGALRAEVVTAGDDLTPQFDAVNAGREWTDSGWQVYDAAPTVVYAAKNGRVHMFQPQHVTTADGTPVAAGTIANVVISRRAPESLQPGFYIALGQTPYELADDATSLRFYFNVEERGAARLMAAVTRIFNRFEVPFRFKSLRYSGVYTRRDAAVLFTGRRYFPIAERLVRLVHAEAGDILGDSVPLLTRRVLPGVGFAEDPGNGESFGMSRCRLIAASVWEAFIRGRTSPAERLDEAEIQFRVAGIDPARPWLRPGSSDPFEGTSS